MKFVTDAGYSLDSVLAKNEVLFLRDKANASSGGDVIDVTDSIPESVAKSAVSVVQSIPGLECCGVDVLYNEDTGVFTTIEINARAQVGVNMYPSYGVGRNVPKGIIDTYFPEAPRKHEDANPDIVFDVEAALSPLISGVLGSVTLAPINEYSDFSKKYLELRGVVSESLKKISFDKLAGRHGVIGFAAADSNGMVRIYFAGESKSIKCFISEVLDILPCREHLVRPWKGPVKHGFYTRYLTS